MIANLADTSGMVSGPEPILGRAIFIRTDRLDYGEEEIAFRTMDELFRLCMEPQKKMSLQRIVLCRELEHKPCTVTLDFVSASSARPESKFQALLR